MYPYKSFNILHIFEFCNIRNFVQIYNNFHDIAMLHPVHLLDTSHEYYIQWRTQENLTGQSLWLASEGVREAEPQHPGEC